MDNVGAASQRSYFVCDQIYNQADRKTKRGILLNWSGRFSYIHNAMSILAEFSRLSIHIIL